ncbi:hypothetical protein [Campylobacter geochelonis]|uniref:Peptide deformylase n=1 Tax=Campylobacter geochelonis TaxID=1780362 RepID=A0A128EM14_9BACT|nr:hypothetical protein [Campylobacter geochelonis]QKF70977.1 hypothetical protein CGEO_0656 [Campylobacter geochelonis]CZE47081.1 peptide deformylase [Campylobacter geochelonis]CZE47565.1 peptide deformylase [Campylobacter geochelonis]CZE50207.1 peptide deformylase [Campylobacter geochelonis]
MKKILLLLALMTSFSFAAQTPPAQAKAPEIKAELKAEDVPAVLNQIALEVTMGLPKRLDYITTVDRVTSKKNNIKYYYILNDDEDFVLSKFDKTRKNEFRNQIIKGAKSFLCQNANTLELMKKGAIFHYIYDLRDGKRYFSFFLEAKDCK